MRKCTLTFLEACRAARLVFLFTSGRGEFCSILYNKTQHVFAFNYKNLTTCIYCAFLVDRIHLRCALIGTKTLGYTSYMASLVPRIEEIVLEKGSIG